MEKEIGGVRVDDKNSDINGETGGGGGGRDCICHDDVCVGGHIYFLLP